MTRDIDDDLEREVAALEDRILRRPKPGKRSDAEVAARFDELMGKLRGEFAGEDPKNDALVRMALSAPLGPEPKTDSPFDSALAERVATFHARIAALEAVSAPQWHTQRRGEAGSAPPVPEGAEPGDAAAVPARKAPERPRGSSGAPVVPAVSITGYRPH